MSKKTELEDRIVVLEREVQIAAGMLSTTDGFKSHHPAVALEAIRAAARLSVGDGDTPPVRIVAPDGSSNIQPGTTLGIPARDTQPRIDDRGNLHNKPQTFDPDAAPPPNEGTPIGAGPVHVFDDGEQDETSEEALHRCRRAFNSLDPNRSDEEAARIRSEYADAIVDTDAEE